MTSGYSPNNRYAARTAPRYGGLLGRPILLIGVAVTAATGYVIHALWPSWPDPVVGPNAPTLPITVAGTAFNIPPAAIRVRLQRQPGAHERVDLVYLWPSLTPPDNTAASEVPVKGALRPEPFERIFVTVAAARESIPPEERAKAIYPRYIDSAPVEAPAGLVVLPFREGTPYQGEDLVYDAAAPERFMARCSRNGSAATPGICLNSRRIETADVTTRFPRDWLGDWQMVAGNIDKLIAGLRPQPQ